MKIKKMSQNEKVKRKILLILTVLNSLLMLFFAMMTAVGSLEMLPTPEQVEKARIAYLLILLPLTVCEVTMIRKLVKRDI